MCTTSEWSKNQPWSFPLGILSFYGWLMEKPDLKWMTTGGTPSLGIPPFIYPLVICYIAMEHGPFIDGLPIKNGDFPWLC